MNKEEQIALYTKFLDYINSNNYEIIGYCVFDNDFDTLVGPLGEVFDRYIHNVL